MRKVIVSTVLLVILVGCAGEQVGDSFSTGAQDCVTTMEYKWVWSFFEDSGLRKVPVTTCVETGE